MYTGHEASFPAVYQTAIRRWLNNSGGKAGGGGGGGGEHLDKFKKLILPPSFYSLHNSQLRI